MPNDAKLGLVIGIALVLVIGLVFFKRDHGDGNGPPTASTSAAIGSAGGHAKEAPASSR